MHNESMETQPIEKEPHQNLIDEIRTSYSTEITNNKSEKESKRAVANKILPELVNFTKSEELYRDSLDTLKEAERELRQEPDKNKEMITIVRSIRGSLVYEKYVNEAFDLSANISTDTTAFKKYLKESIVPPVTPGAKPTHETPYSYIKKNSPPIEVQEKITETVQENMINAVAELKQSVSETMKKDLKEAKGNLFEGLKEKIQKATSQVVEHINGYKILYTALALTSIGLAVLNMSGNRITTISDVLAKESETKNSAPADMINMEEFNKKYMQEHPVNKESNILITNLEPYKKEETQKPKEPFEEELKNPESALYKINALVEKVNSMPENYTKGLGYYLKSTDSEGIFKSIRSELDATEGNKIRGIQAAKLAAALDSEHITPNLGGIDESDIIPTESKEGQKIAEKYGNLYYSIEGLYIDLLPPGAIVKLTKTGDILFSGGQRGEYIYVAESTIIDGKKFIVVVRVGEVGNMRFQIISEDDINKELQGNSAIVIMTEENLKKVQEENKRK